MLDHEGLEQVVRKTMRRLSGQPCAFASGDSGRAVDSQTDHSAPTRIPSATASAASRKGDLTGRDRAVAVLRAIRPDLSLRQAQALVGGGGGGGYEP